jgi:SulP family sulfate permease
MKLKSLFNLKHFRGDLLGGLTAGIVALPLALAFGVGSGLGPTAGLYGAIFISFFAALFGGTNTQISGPTAPMTALSTVLVGTIIANSDGNIANALPLILTVFFAAGIIQIVLGMLGLGRYIKYIPYPVVSGFMTAIGVIIIVTQLLPVLGYYPQEDVAYVEQFRPHAEEVILNNILKEEAGEGLLVLEDFKVTIARAEHIPQEQIQKESEILASKESSGVKGALMVIPKAVKQVNWLELLLAIGTILIIYLFKLVTKKIPSTLVALLVISSIAMGFNLDYRTIEAIPSGIPNLQLGIFTSFNAGQFAPYIFTALSLALLGAIDSLLTSVVADNMTKTKHKPNKELVGQGIGNSIASLFGGLPGAGATIRTVVNINAGGKTRLSGIISSLLLVVILLSLGPLASKIPAAVLAGILITVGISVMDFKGLRAIPYMPKAEVLIMVIVLVLASVWNLVYAVGVGLVIGSLTFMKQIGELTAERSEVKLLEEEESWRDEKNLSEEIKKSVFIKHIRGPLFFGSTSEFQHLAQKIPDTASTVIIRMGRMQYIDQSGLYALEDVLVELAKKGTTILLVNIIQQPRLMMERIDIIPDLVPKEQIFNSFIECIKWLEMGDVDLEEDLKEHN